MGRKYKEKKRGGVGEGEGVREKKSEREKKGTAGYTIEFD